MRPGTAFAAALLALSGCAGTVGSMQVRALAPYGDRPVALARPAGSGPIAAEVQDGIAAGLARGGLALAEERAPGALVLVPRVLDEREEIAGGRGLRTAGGLLGSAGKAAVDLVQAGSAAYNASRLRLELVLRAPEHAEPLGAAFWDGFLAGDGRETARRGAEALGEALAAEIAVQRGRWFTRRIADERLVLTATPNLIPPGEWVLSNDEALLFHLGRGFTEWLQLDLTLGALPIPVAGGVAVAGEGVAAAGVAGIGVVGALGVGLKVKLLEEGRLHPGAAVAYDMLNVWGGALGGGGIVLLGKGVAATAAGGAAGFNLQFNLFTGSLSKHFWDWLQLGAGLYVLDNHAFLPQAAGFVVVDTSGGGSGSGSRITDRVPTIALPWLSAEAAAGNHVRFFSEWLLAPGDDWAVLGMRTLVYRTRMGLARTGHVAFKLDTALMFNRYTDSHTGGRKTGVFPWLGLALYFR